MLLADIYHFHFVLLCLVGLRAEDEAEEHAYAHYGIIYGIADGCEK